MLTLSPLEPVLLREWELKRVFLSLSRGSRFNPVLDMLASFKKGNIGGVKVHVDRLQVCGSNWKRCFLSCIVTDIQKHNLISIWHYFIKQRLKINVVFWDCGVKKWQRKQQRDPRSRISATQILKQDIEYVYISQHDASDPAVCYL